MLIAIPSISELIYNSRINTYVNSIDGVVTAARVKRMDGQATGNSKLYKVDNGVTELNYEGKLEGK